MNIFEEEIVTRCPGETRKFGESFARRLAPGDVVALTGGLGAGKTCLAQGIGWGLGIDRGIYLSSPTFTIVKQYRAKMPVYHMDLYRLENLDEVLMLGYEEYVNSDGVLIIEWADKIPDFAEARGAGQSETIKRLIPPEAFTVNILIEDENKRRIKIRSGN